MNRTAGSFSPWLITESGSSRNTPTKFSGYSSAYTPAISIREAESDCRSASASWINTGGESGWRNQCSEQDPRSASPSPPAPVSEKSGVEEQETAAESTILLIEDNETDVFVIKEVLRQSGR